MLGQKAMVHFPSSGNLLQVPQQEPQDMHLERLVQVVILVVLGSDRDTREPKYCSGWPFKASEKY